jgi:hypothetical protein
MRGKKRSPGVIGIAMALLLTALATDASAQSSRPFQMSILSATDDTSTAHSDIPIFTRGIFRDQTQPPAPVRSIVWLKPDANLDQYPLDWTLIVGVYVDEPYGQILSAFNPPPFGWYDACSTNANIYQALLDRESTLQAMAAALHLKAPQARFWVNFSEAEIDSIGAGPGCAFNQPYIDVVSMDIYHVDFQTTLSSRYQFLYAHRPTDHQQLALAAGTFTDGQQTGAQAASRLSGYFAYAASMNQQCNLPLGPIGFTGRYDGCPVWMVAGWTGGQTPPADAPDVRPIDSSNSTAVFNAWQGESAARPFDSQLARRVGSLIPAWFNN